MKEHSFLLLHGQTKATSGDMGPAAELFSPEPVQCEPIYFSSHNPLPFFPLSFWLIEFVRLS